MDKKTQLQRFEEYLAKYPELMAVHNLEEFEALLAELPEEVPHELWEIIEPTIVHKEEIHVQQPHEKKHTSEKHKDKEREHGHSAHTAAANSFHISGTVDPRSVEEHPEYVRLKNQRKKEWLENRPGIDEDAYVARAYFSNISIQAKHPIDDLFPYEKVRSDFEEDVRKEFFKLHPELKAADEAYERTKRYDNPLHDPTYLQSMLDAKQKTREWYDRQVAEGHPPTPTQLERHFSIEKAHALATFQNEHPLKSDIYREQFGSIEKAISKAKQEALKEDTSKQEKKETKGFRLIDQSAQEKMPSLSFKLPSRELRQDEEYRQFREIIREEKIRSWERDHPKSKWTDRVYDPEYTKYFKPDPETGDLPFYEDAERMFRNMRPEKAAAYDANERRKIYEDPLFDPIYRQFVDQASTAANKAVVDARKASIRTRAEEEEIYLRERYRYSLAFTILFPEKATGYAQYDKQFLHAINYIQVKGSNAHLFGRQVQQEGDVSSESLDTIFKAFTGVAPSTKAEHIARTPLPINPQAPSNDESYEAEEEDNEGEGTKAAVGPAAAEDKITRPRKNVRESVMRARKRVQQAKDNARRVRQVADRLKKVEKAVKVARTAAALFSQPEVWVVIGIILLILLFIIILSGILNTNNLEQRRGYIDDRTLAKVNIVKQGPSVVEIPRKPDPLPDDPNHTEPDWDKVYVIYKLTATYPGIAEDVTIDEQLPEGAELIEGDDPTTAAIEGTTKPFKRLDENGELVRNPRDMKIIEWSLKDLQRPARVATPDPSNASRNLAIYTNPPYYFPATNGSSDVSYSEAELTRLNELGGRVRKYDSYLSGIVNGNDSYTDPFLSVIWAGAIVRTGGNPYYWKCGSRSVNDGCPDGFSSGQWITGYGMPVNKAVDSLYSVFAAVYGSTAAEDPEKIGQIGQQIIILSGSSPLGTIQKPTTFPKKRLGVLIDEAKDGNADSQQALAVLLMDPDIAAVSLARMIALDIAQTNNWATTLRGRGYSDLQTYANRVNAIAQKYTGNIVGRFDGQEISITFRVRRDMWIANTAVGTVIGAQRPDDRTPGELPNTTDCGGFYTLNNKINKNFGDPSCTLKGDKDKIFQELESQLGGSSDRMKWFAVIIPCESGYNANAFADHEAVGTPDQGGAWGLFQMGSCIDAPGTACDGKNGPYDKGDVPWQTQIRNAVEYNRILERNRRKWTYWACARQYWGQP